MPLHRYLASCRANCILAAGFSFLDYVERLEFEAPETAPLSIISGPLIDFKSLLIFLSSQKS